VGFSRSQEVNGTLIMPSEDAFLNPNFPLAAGGVVFLVGAVIFMRAGRALGRFGVGGFTRAEEPTQFWWSVAIFCGVGFGLIGIYLYGIYKFPN
jgi:hypothetical protein